MSNDTALKRWAEERKYFLKVVDCVQFLALQGLSFSGHDTTETNFLQVILQRFKDNPELITEKSSMPKQYLHQDYQNELLRIMSQHTLRKLLESIF